MRKLIILGCAATILLAGCGIPEEEHNAALKKIEDLESKLDNANSANKKANEQIAELKAENQRLAARLIELGEDVNKLKSDKTTLASDLEEAKRLAEELKRKQELQQARLATFRNMLSRFREMINSGKLRVRIVRGRMVVEMSSNILFPSGKAKLTDEGQEALAQVASVLATIPDRDFQVAGHTDNVPINTAKFRSNWELSTERSVTVVKFLQDAGVDAVHLSAAGYAEYQPAASNETKEGKAQNRRIEIVLMPNLDELPDLSSLESEAKQGN